MINKKIENLANRVLQNISIRNYNEIDLVKICKFNNIEIVEKELENDISGFYLIKNEKSFIVYNSLEGEMRQRFTIAHELGHHFLHSNIPLFVEKKNSVANQMFHRDHKSSTGEILREREANAFAAALLMPEKMIDIEVFESDKILFEDLIKDLAKKFKVSEQAMSFRLANLGYRL